MTPGAYRALGAEVFLIQLPAGYGRRRFSAYHARDPESLSETQRRQQDLEGAC